ncbi:MAG: hypothetical protein HXY38_10910 [Chloroflexi bacterium]|nr:hypothetical protein [Chloroflexota bacterium]
MSRRSAKILSLIAATTLMLACMPTLGPAPAPLPTFDPNAPLTAIVETAAVAATQTAIHAPPTATATALPTKTPTDTPPPTPTFIIIFVTKTQPPTMMPVGVSGKELDCQVLDVSPKELVAASSLFTAKWTVANVGKSEWDENNMDYRYADGTRMYQQSIYDLPATIAPGVIVELTAAMKAPDTPGAYTTIWQINSGNRRFCTLELTITVP